ncbi:hypothetical protein AOQ71_10085 [Bradyrhizobium manausense]|uniref:Uncharacterized protein n=1 Tax=Bradyrhizobium manausense TaxID=989370 RepID=A0A0R3DZI1_9BRAD|nr:hypothetical protein AOQ71_10085 [Bradyrhizobium manausense]
MWFGSSLLLYLLLEGLALIGFDNATMSRWNEESIHALVSYQLFEWWDCAPRDVASQCGSNPLLYLLSSKSLSEFVTKTLQLLSGIAFLLWILGAKMTSRREVLVGLPLMFVLVMILFAIPFVIGTILGFLNIALYFVGLGRELRVLALSLLSLLALPIVLPVALITTVVLAATTIVSVPVLIVSYVVSGVLEHILPAKPALPPTLPLIFGQLTATTFHCLSSGSEAIVHEYLKHGLLRFSRSLRP